MTLTVYREWQNAYNQTAKAILKDVATDVKKNYKNDKPLIRMTINDTADSLCRDYNLSEYQRDLLANYACKLHPKRK